MNLYLPSYRILYNNKNISTDVSDYLLDLTYTDKVSGESDEVELTFHDKDGLWQNDWYPAKGAFLQVFVVDGDAELPCGKFTIDENELQSGVDGDLFTIRGVAAGVTKALRSNRSTAHENKTLRELCRSVAAAHGLTVQGTIADIRIGRVTQNKMSDLQFLNRIADLYGYAFTIRDDKMIFTSLVDLHTRTPSLALDKTECSGFSFKDKMQEVVKEVTVAHRNPTKGKLVKKTVKRDAIADQLLAYNLLATSTGAPLIGATNVTTEVSRVYSEDEISPMDEKLLNAACDNEQQAEEIAKTAMLKSIVKESSCEVTCRGHVLLVSGNQVELTGFGRFSGKYLISESTHSLNKSGGYTTNFTALRSQKLPKSKRRPKKKSS